MFEFIEHDQCISILRFGLPVVITILLGSMSLLSWICWDDWRMKKEEEVFEKSLLVPEPLDVEEIPRKNLYFQKLAIQIYTNNISSGETMMDKINELYDWMLEHQHTNTEDIEKIITTFNDNEMTNYEYQEIQLWMDTAFRIWACDPKWIMPAWMPTIIRRNRSWTVS